jgi:hypothetical protein
MAPENQLPEEERALRILENLHEGGDDSDAPVDAASIARMRAAIDRSFEIAWKRVHEQAEAEARAAIPRRRSLAGWARDALLARLRELQAALGPQLQLAHRHLATMSDDDLRALVEDVEKDAERLSPAP